MTPAIPLLSRHAMKVDGPGWLNLFQVTVAGGFLPSFVWASSSAAKKGRFCHERYNRTEPDGGYGRAWKTMLSVLVGLQERSFGTGDRIQKGLAFGACAQRTMRRICVPIRSFLRAVAPASRADRRRATVLSVPHVCLTGSGSQERAHPGDQGT
jgi:hypothetical protein